MRTIGLFGDVTFDIADLFRKAGKTKHTSAAKENSGKHLDVKLFAGIGAAYTFGIDNVPLSYQHPYNRNSKVLPGVRAGITVAYQMSDNWRLGVELSNTFFDDRFNGVKAETPYDSRTNLKVGVTYLLVKKSKRKTVNPTWDDPRLRVIPALPFQIPAGEVNKVREIKGRAFLDFIVDRTEIREDYRRNAQEIKRIVESINNILFDKIMHISSISLHGYASPESPYNHNVELSMGRANALKRYLQNHFNLDASTSFELNNTPEDWGNLRRFIEQSGSTQRVKDDVWYESISIQETPEMPEVILQNKDALLSIIDRQIDPDEKEQLLKQVAGGEPYRWLLRHVYPGLRHTDYIIRYEVREYPVKEAKRLIYTHPEALSLNEMYRVANSYSKGSDEWLDALLIAAKQYPEDETANLNAACACITVKRPTDAKRYLDKAGNGEQARYLNDVISAMNGSVKWKLEGEKLVIDR